MPSGEKCHCQICTLVAWEIWHHMHRCSYIGTDNRAEWRKKKGAVYGSEQPGTIQILFSEKGAGPISKTVSLGVDMTIQEDVGLSTDEPTALVSKEGVDPIVKESLLQKNVAVEVKAVVPIVRSKVITPIAAAIEPKVPIADSFVEPIQPSSFHAITEGNSR